VIRVAHIADSHFDERRRLDDNVAVHRAFLDQVRDAGVDLIVHAGDFFERRSSVAERNALAEFLTQAAEIAPVVGVRGNHDAPGDLDVFTRLETEHGVAIADRPSVGDAPRLSLAMGEGEDVDDPTADVFFLPWFDKSYLVATLGPEVPAAESTAHAMACARRLLDLMRAGIAESVSRGHVPIVVGHCLVAGSETSTGQTLIGSTVELAPGELADLDAAYVALGHIHKHQAWGDRVVYAGSPQRQNFGESEPKGWVLVEIDPRRWREHGGVSWEFRELPAREIVPIEQDWSFPGVVPELIKIGAVTDGALVRLRYRIRPEDLHLVDEDAIRAALLAAGAHEVKLEAVLVHEARARCSEIVTAESTWDRVLCYWRAKQVQVTHEQADRVHRKLLEMEQPTRSVAAVQEATHATP
jgi:exonuclease SbcD